MKPSMHISHLFLAFLVLSDDVSARKPSNAVLLTSVKTLTVRKDSQTSNRRVPAIPQLKCVGGPGKGHYEVDVMRCKNQGSSYDENEVEWSCTASLPDEFKLGSTDVVCEGYDSPTDPYILKGSCGVEYRLMLTPKGQEKYGSGSFLPHLKPHGLTTEGAIFGLIFLAVAGWILYSIYLAWTGTATARRPPRAPRTGGFGGFNGGGGGGGGGGGDDDASDPPPPYPGKPSSSTRRTTPQTGWTPGFWTGALGGAAAASAAGYVAGNRGQQRAQPGRQTRGWFSDDNTGGWPSSSGGGWNSGSAGPSRSNSGSSSRHESTGFGSTSRR